MGEFDELEVLAAGLNEAVGGQVRAALERCRAPIGVQVAGRDGVGRASVAAALGLSPDTVTTPVDAVGHPDPVLDGDVVVYVLAGAPHPADERVCADSRKLVIRNKVDLSDGGGDDALSMVATLALATARHEITAADHGRFRALAAARDATLLLAESLFRSAEADVDLDDRAALLDRWGFAGVACAVTALRRAPDLDPARLHRILRSASGVDAAARALAARIDAARTTRRDLLYADLAAIVARTGCEPVERLVESRMATRA